MARIESVGIDVGIAGKRNNQADVIELNSRNEDSKE